MKLADHLGALPSGRIISMSPDAIGRHLATHYLLAEGERKRVKLAQGRLDLYRDETAAALRASIQTLFRNARVRDWRLDLVEFSLFQNLTRRIVNDTATVYSEPATITATDGVRVIRQGDRIRNPVAGALAITGYAPSLRFDYRYAPGTSLTITGYAPAVRRDYTITPETGQLGIETAAGTAELGSRALTLTVGTLAITGYAPQMVRTDAPVASVTVAGLAITGYTPGVLVGDLLAPAAGTLSTVIPWRVSIMSACASSSMRTRSSARGVPPRPPRLAGTP
jgi:hypothetical protein